MTQLQPLLSGGLARAARARASARTRRGHAAGRVIAAAARRRDAARADRRRPSRERRPRRRCPVTTAPPVPERPPVARPPPLPLAPAAPRRAASACATGGRATACTGPGSAAAATARGDSGIDVTGLVERQERDRVGRVQVRAGPVGTVLLGPGVQHREPARVLPALARPGLAGQRHRHRRRRRRRQAQDVGPFLDGLGLVVVVDGRVRRAVPQLHARPMAGVPLVHRPDQIAPLLSRVRDRAAGAGAAPLVAAARSSPPSSPAGTPENSAPPLKTSG